LTPESGRARIRAAKGLEGEDCAEPLLFDIRSYYTRRTVDFRDGVINIEMAVGEGGQLDVIFNFHRATSDQGQLESWLEIPMADFRERVDSLVARILDLETAHA
jgi:hypothetical protein